MKTKMKVTLAFVPLVVAASLMYSGYQKSVNVNDFKLLNAESLAEAEHIGGGYYSNFTMQVVWYKSGVQISITEPFISWGWSPINCCVASCDANACDFNAENSLCATNLTRPPRN